LAIVVRVARTEPFHAPDQTTFHDNTECLLGDSLPEEQRTPGDGGKERCRLCDALNRAEETQPRVVPPAPEFP
jgi:hypothetical protein